MLAYIVSLKNHRNPSGLYDNNNSFMQSQHFSLSATTKTTVPNPDEDSDDFWVVDSGATYSTTFRYRDLHHPIKLLIPIPITSADGTIIYATHVGSSCLGTLIHYVPRSAVKLVSVGALTAYGYMIRTEKDRSIVITTPTRSTLCSCPIQSNNTWIFPAHLMSGKFPPTTAVPTDTYFHLMSGPYFHSAFREKTDTLPRKRSSALLKLVSFITSFAIPTTKHSSPLLIKAPSRIRLIS